MRGEAVTCPHCEKGIVVPERAKKPILAPTSQRSTARTDSDFNLREFQRHIPEQAIKENKGMGNARQLSVDFDFIGVLRLIGLLVVIGVVAFDIFAVRSKNKMLRQSIETQKAAYEKRIQDMQADFDSRMEKYGREPSPSPSLQQSVDDSPKLARCKNCSGKGTIQVKKRCQQCGGSGRIRETHTRWTHGDYIRDGHYSTSTTYVDCPSCLPGPFRGGGSKGYTIETETCPKCGGSGKVELK